MDQPGRLTILAEQLRYSGGRTFRTGRTRIEEAPPGVVVVTESGRVVEVGDTFKASDVLRVVPDGAWFPLVRPAFRENPALAFSVLLPLASALFGWLP